MKTNFSFAYPSAVIGALAACMAIQGWALKTSGGRTTKSESNFFSSLGRIQAGTVGKPEVMLLGSSITGRLPDRANGFGGFANMGCDGGSAVDALLAMDRGILPLAPILVIEANTLNRALDARPSEVGLAMTRPWFKVGTELPLLSAYARPSAFAYSKLLAHKIGGFDSTNDEDLKVSSVPGDPEIPSEPIQDEERALINRLVPAIARMQQDGTRIVFVWLPPGRGVGIPAPAWIRALVAESESEWWDIGNDCDRSLVTLTDGTHMSAPSAARTVVTLRKGLAAASGR